VAAVVCVLRNLIAQGAGNAEASGGWRTAVNAATEGGYVVEGSIPMQLAISNYSLDDFGSRMWVTCEELGQALVTVSGTLTTVQTGNG
jgi:hypothetical protein